MPAAQEILQQEQTPRLQQKSKELNNIPEKGSKILGFLNMDPRNRKFCARL